MPPQKNVASHPSNLKLPDFDVGLLSENHHKINFIACGNLLVAWALFCPIINYSAKSGQAVRKIISQWDPSQLVERAKLACEQ